MVVRGFVYKDISSITVFHTDDIALDPALLHEKLLKLLPEYMIPTNYIRLNEFPILPSGKIDKQNIFPPEGNWDQFKANPVSFLPKIDKGENFETYDMGCGKVVRRFGPSTPFGRVWKEPLLMQKSYENGTSAAKACGIVRFESDYGILMDRNKS